ncbi:hypothetical protein SAY86_004560 [Trapa natans]|uniref:WRC domain-containing protein n=1 Tax=Trapa natans TaxID=22666 RepID=A0AAN7N6T5_TRANT|nr:hypothetical protein SAY86_004560 [Trapa natans]
MRIRKNAKLSSLSALSSPSPAASSQSHVCQLNQSPWDVISFSHDSSFPSTTTFHPDDRHLPHHHQPDRSDSFTLNASFGNSRGPVYRNWKEDNDADNDNGNGYYYEKDNDAGRGVVLGAGNGMMRRTGSCRKTNGKGWQCSREAKQGHYLCEHHLKKSHQGADTSIGNIINMVSGGLDSTNELPALAITASAAASSSSSIKKVGAAGRRGRPPKKAPPSKSSSSDQPMNSSQFYYYYSGFGPSWGRRRAIRSGNGGGPKEHEEEEDYRVVDEMEEEMNSGRSCGTPPPLSHHQMGRQVEVEIDYTAMAYDMDDDEEEDEENEENEEELANEESSRGRRKRMRKPVKARSLKSLM